MAPLPSPPLLAESLATLRTASPSPPIPCSPRRTRPLVSARFARTAGRRSRSTGGRRDLRSCAYAAEAEYGSAEDEVADDFYSVLGVVSVLEHSVEQFLCNNFGLQFIRLVGKNCAF